MIFFKKYNIIFPFFLHNKAHIIISPKISSQTMVNRQLQFLNHIYLHLQQISHKLFLKTHILYISPHKKRTTGIFIIKCLITQNAPNRSNTKFPTTIKTGLEHPNNCTRTILETPRK